MDLQNALAIMGPQNRGLEAGHYQYQPFSADGKTRIRIATIEPASFDDEVKITLRHEIFETADSFSLEATEGEAQPGSSRVVPDPGSSGRESGQPAWPIYDALSYSWGPVEKSPTKIQASHCLANGTISEGWLPARTNLISALRHLRRADRTRDIWIDAICIDQDDKVGKSPQFAMMGDIYKCVASVVVWLGPAGDQTDLVMDKMQDFGVTETDLTELDTPLRLSGLEIQGFLDIFSRQWFKKLWVRQEVTLANQDNAIVQCGFASLAWNSLRTTWLLLKQKKVPSMDIATQLHDRIVHSEGFLGQVLIRIQLAALRFQFGDSQCTDGRDRIYGIRAMLSEDLKRSIVPNYPKFVAEVYQDATLAEMYTYNSFNILTECQFTNTWKGPSWVPNWSLNDESYKFDFELASSRIRTKFEVQGSNTLLVYGVEVATVERLDQILFKGSMKETLHGLLHKERRRLDTPYLRGGTILGAYTRILCNDKFRGIWSIYPFWPLQEEARQILSDINRGYLVDLEDSTTKRVMSWVGMYCHRRQLLFTSEGCLGLAPSVARKGDKVCVVINCDTLFLLRPSGGRSEARYQVIGECSLCGAEYGEALLGPLPEHIQIVCTKERLANKKETCD